LASKVKIFPDCFDINRKIINFARLKNRRDNNGEKESLLYSLEGSLCRHTSPKGITKIFDYDYLGRITKVRYYERGPIKEPFKVDAYFYNAFRLLSESTGNGKIKYCYNTAGDLIQQTLAQNDSSVWWRNGISRIEDGNVIDFAYDALGRLRETKKWKDHAHYALYTQNYDAVGKIVEEKVEDEQGKILSAGTYLDIDSTNLYLPAGFGTRHRCCAAITYNTDALAVLVSESGGVVKVFKKGKIIQTL